MDTSPLSQKLQNKWQWKKLSHKAKFFLKNIYGSDPHAHDFAFAYYIFHIIIHFIQSLIKKTATVHAFL